MSPKAVMLCLALIGIAMAFGYLGVPLIVAHFAHHIASTKATYTPCPSYSFQGCGP